jgi:quercetin dioxygenase-like cupin family protein
MREEEDAMTTATVEEIRIGPIAVRFLVGGDATGGSAALFEFDVAAGTPAPPAHSHESWEETIYGVRGTLTWTVDGAATEVGPGEVLCIPRGVVHHFENLGAEAATQLAVVTPGVLGPDYFRDLAALFGGDGPPDRAAMLDVMRRHGLTPAA